MRVGILAHLLNFEPGFRQAGVSRYVEHLLAELPRLAPEDQFIAYAGTSALALAPEALRSGVHWSTSRLPTTRPEVRILWEQLCAPVAVAQHRLDVIHAPVNVSPRLARRPSVVTVHDLAFLHSPEQYPNAKQRYLSELTRRSVERATRVIAVSESTRRDVLGAYRVDPARVVTVPNGVDARFHPHGEAARAAFRARHALPPAFALFVGTLQPRKNLIGLLRAWARVRTEWPLVVVGAVGWQSDPIFAEARALRLDERVIFAGYAGDLPSWYDAATIFVYPSFYEGFGLPVLEAMASGTPVVTSSTSSLPEVAGDAALTVDPADVGALAAALQRLVDDPPLRAELAARGRARARSFSWPRTARETLAVYRDAAGGG